MKHNFTVEGHNRLDLFLTEKLEISRSQIQKIIKNNQVTINEKIAPKPGVVLNPGDLLEVEIIEETPKEINDYEFDLKILFEDDYLLVIDKPANLTMHPGAGNKDKTLFNAVYTYLKGKKPEMVHRLDKDTSGVVVVAKTLEIRNLITEQFSERTVNRLYHALVLTTPRSKRKVQIDSEGSIETLLGRHPKDRMRMAVLEDSGKKSITTWVVEQEYPYGALLRLKLGTGRTHQIRVHMDYLGSPVLGDPTYGDFSPLPNAVFVRAKSFGRQALHASSLEFTHPVTGERLKFESSPPADFQELKKFLEEYQ